ncbi:hypothetical protein X742_05660 [Mesorhizobium sp. LNHC232B00]|nr:hypothetical protein X742_05660 [Mesorhizobium sp. LNHC232B00]
MSRSAKIFAERREIDLPTSTASPAISFSPAKASDRIERHT